MIPKLYCILIFLGSMYVAAQDTFGGRLAEAAFLLTKEKISYDPRNSALPTPTAMCLPAKECAPMW